MVTRYASVVRSFFLIRHMYANDVWLGGDPRAYNIIKHIFKRDWTTTSNHINYSSILNSQQN